MAAETAPAAAAADAGIEGRRGGQQLTPWGWGGRNAGCCLRSRCPHSLPAAAAGIGASAVEGVRAVGRTLWRRGSAECPGL
eukprot:1138629-Pelagomonas_calceolata.AAC.6